MVETPKTLKALNRMIEATPPFVKGSSRAVLGEGPLHPALALVGEQPGDYEDRQGRPFVGPAGKLLDKALAEAGIDRKAVYVTNAVKHFKFEQRGKKRLHARPNAGEVKHYRWWLQKELEIVKPRVAVAMGATATLARFLAASMRQQIEQHRFHRRVGAGETLDPAFERRLIEIERPVQ